MKKLTFVTTIYNIDFIYLDELFSSFGEMLNDDRIEFICVDDASTEYGSFELLKEKFGNNKNFIFHKMEVNTRRTGAFAKGIALSTGDYLMSLDSDDLVHESALKLFLLTLESFKDVDFILNNWVERNYSSKIKYGMSCYAGETHELFSDYWKAINPQAVLSAYNSIVSGKLARSIDYKVDKVKAPHDDAYFSQAWISNSDPQKTFYIDLPFFIYNVSQPWTTNSGSKSISNVKNHEILIKEIIKLYNRNNKLSIINITSILQTHYKFLKSTNKWKLIPFWFKVKLWVPRKIRKQKLFKKSAFVQKYRSGIWPI